MSIGELAMSSNYSLSGGRGTLNLEELYRKTQRIATSEESSKAQRKRANRQLSTLSQEIRNRIIGADYNANPEEEKKSAENKLSNIMGYPIKMRAPYASQHELRGGLNGAPAHEEGSSPLIPSNILLRAEESETPDANEAYNRAMNELDWE